MSRTSQVSSSPLFNKKVKKGRVVNQNEIKELGITEITLSNGVKVILKPTDFKNDQILMQAFSPGGNTLVADADYVSNMAAEINGYWSVPMDESRLKRTLVDPILRKI